MRTTAQVGLNGHMMEGHQTTRTGTAVTLLTHKDVVYVSPTRLVSCMTYTSVKTPKQQTWLDGFQWCFAPCTFLCLFGFWMFCSDFETRWEHVGPNRPLRPLLTWLQQMLYYFKRKKKIQICEGSSIIVACFLKLLLDRPFFVGGQATMETIHFLERHHQTCI
jgi:hypothetical protein